MTPPSAPPPQSNAPASEQPARKAEVVFQALARAASLGNLEQIKPLFGQVPPPNQQQVTLRALHARHLPAMVWMCTHGYDPQALAARMIEHAASRDYPEAIQALLPMVDTSSTANTASTASTTQAAVHAVQANAPACIRLLLPVCDPVKVLRHLAIALDPAADHLVPHLSTDMQERAYNDSMLRRIVSQRPTLLPGLSALFEALAAHTHLDQEVAAPGSHRPAPRL